MHSARIDYTCVSNTAASDDVLYFSKWYCGPTVDPTWILLNGDGRFWLSDGFWHLKIYAEMLLFAGADGQLLWFAGQCLYANGSNHPSTLIQRFAIWLYTSAVLTAKAFTFTLRAAQNTRIPHVNPWREVIPLRFEYFTAFRTYILLFDNTYVRDDRNNYCEYHYRDPYNIPWHIGTVLSPMHLWLAWT